MSVTGAIPTRSSLLSRLKDFDDQQSWQEFYATYRRLILGVALKAGLAEAEAQDVVQETLISVSRQIQTFHYDPARGSFKGWLRLITQRRIADHLRKKYRQGPAARGFSESNSRTGTVERIPDVSAGNWDAIWDAEWERNLLATALDRVKRIVRPKQYQIFDLYVLKQWPVQKVIAALGVSMGQVYLAKHRVSAVLKAELKGVTEKMGG